MGQWNEFPIGTTVQFVRDASVLIEVTGPGDDECLFAGKIVASDSPLHKVGTSDDCWYRNDFVEVKDHA